MDGVPRLAATLLYGTGLRLLECLELRIKDVEFARGEILIRDGKGRKDRITMLPGSVREQLLEHMSVVHTLHRRDLDQGAGAVALPDALTRKYPNACRDWRWQWVFPASSCYIDQEARIKRRLSPRFPRYKLGDCNVLEQRACGVSRIRRIRIKTGIRNIQRQRPRLNTMLGRPS